MTPHNIPRPLVALKAWLIWRYEPNGDKKPRKVPYWVDGRRRFGQQGGPDDLASLATFSKAQAAARKRGFDGVGIALLPKNDVLALDFDNCVENGQLHPEVAALVGDTYAEFSPSGKGVRAFFKGHLGNFKDHASPPFGLELFSDKGFVTVTGNALPSVELLGLSDTVAPIPLVVNDYVRKRFGAALEVRTSESAHEPLGLSDAQIDQCLSALPSDLTYDDWLHVGMALHHETNGEGFEVWDEWSARSPKYSAREYGIARWNSFGKGDSAPYTARSLVRLANVHGANLVLNGPAKPEEFDAVEPPTPSAAKPSRFQIEDIPTFLSRPRPKWIIQGVLPRAELAVIYGEPGSGKSFQVLDMGMAIARGCKWRGLHTEPGRVVYIVAEGAGGFRDRVEAYTKHFNPEAAPFGVMAAAPNFLEKADAIDVAKAVGKADVVIVDTLAQTTPGGNENSGEDMGKALAHCKGIHRATGALVILVHHSGKDSSKGARGWSGLRGAADAEFEVVRQGDIRGMRVAKQKDGEDGAVFGFKLHTVNLGMDEHDHILTSCVVEPLALTSMPNVNPARKLGDVERVVNTVIQEFAQAQNAGIETDEVIKEAAKRLPAPEDRKRDTRKQRARRALEALCAGDEALYFIEGDTLSIV